MAVSGSVDFVLNRDEVIGSSFELLGVGVEGEALAADDIAVAQRALNLMVKAWQGYGLNLWKRSIVNVPLTASQATYTLGRAGSPDVTTDRPVKVLSVQYKDTSNNNTELTSLSYTEYMELPNRTTEGQPSQYFFNPKLSNAELSFWPVPDTTAASDSVDVLVVQPLNDMDASTDDFDFPQEWLEAIVYNLAVRLAPRYGSLPIQERYLLRAEAKEALELAKNFDVEEGSIFLQPESDSFYG